MSAMKNPGTSERQPTQTLNIKGMKCPMPLGWATTILRDMKPGEILEILATDPGAVDNFQSFSKASGNELVAWSENDGVYRLLLRKSA